MVIYYFTCRSFISSVDAGESSSGILSQLCQQLKTCESKLMAIETSKCISQRWSEASTEYREVKALITSEKRTHLLLKIEQAARERWFLLTLKAKYAGRSKQVFACVYICMRVVCVYVYVCVCPCVRMRMHTCCVCVFEFVIVLIIYFRWTCYCFSTS